MELRQLESFREVVREGSFTGAARKLHMTQPAVSLHVKALEDELGVRLLERDGRGVRLTEAGATLLRTADEALAALDDVRRRIREAAAPDRGRVVIACGDTVALHLLPPVLSEFRRLRPLAEVSIRNHGSQQVLDLVLRREADVGIVTRPPWLDPALWARTIWTEPFLLATPRRHPLAADDDAAAASRAPAAAELDGQAAVLLAKPTETRALVDRALRSLGVSVDVVMESGNLEVVKTYVANGLGISFVPAMGLTARDRQRMAVRPLPKGFPERRLALVRRRDREPTPLAVDLLRLLAQHFRAAGEKEGDDREER
jgi:DNA-binding transcriptional LysR family regulator